MGDMTWLNLATAPVGLYLGDRRAFTIEPTEKRHELDDQEKLLTTPPRVLGRSTLRKAWCEFKVTEVKEAQKPNPRIFDNELELEPKVKKMINALVEQHNKNESAVDATGPDLIQGKGLGLVIMLHGVSNKLVLHQWLTLRRPSRSGENGMLTTV